jgi:hypothetical protein
MLRGPLVAAVLVAIVAPASVEIGACGDKFLRIGRSSRTDGYAAVHPSSILMFVPKAAKPSAVKDFEKQFTKAGHRFQAVATLESLAGAIAAGGVDLILAAGDDVERIAPHVMAAPSRPAILPIAQRARSAAIASLEQRYGHVLRLPADKEDALVQIDHIMRSRSRPASADALGH